MLLYLNLNLMKNTIHSSNILKNLKKNLNNNFTRKNLSNNKYNNSLKLEKQRLKIGLADLNHQFRKFEGVKEQEEVIIFLFRISLGKRSKLIFETADNQDRKPQ